MAGGNVEVAMLERCSHWAQQDRPDHVNARIRAFLKRCDGNDGGGSGGGSGDGGEQERPAFIVS